MCTPGHRKEYTTRHERYPLPPPSRHLHTVTTTWPLRHRGIKGDPLLGSFLSEMQIRDLELVLSGALWTNSRRAHSQILDPHGEVVISGWCRHCNDPEVIEDTYPMFWQCPAWSDVRERYRDALLTTFDADERVPNMTLQQMADLWPRCFQCFGIAPDLDYSWSRDDPDGVGNAPDPPPPLVETNHAEEPPPPPRPPELPAVIAEHWRDGYLCAWSDGACADQAEFRRRRAGWAIFYGLGHPWNHSSPLQGYVQTSDRAELQGIVAAAERHTWSSVPMDLTPDNLANAESACSLLRTLQIPTQTNVDLWQRLQRCVQLRGPQFFRIRWCMGHATDEDEAAGRISHLNRSGNSCADAAAVAAAARHGETLARKEHFPQLRQQVALVQHMQVTMVTARRKVEENWREEAVALQQLQQHELDAAEREGAVVPILVPPAPPPDCSQVRTFTLRTDLDRQRFEAIKRHFSQINWAWADNPAHSSALDDFGVQQFDPGTLKKWRWPVLWLRALRWYWSQLKWSTEGMDGPFDLVPSVPLMLIARDFSLATHVHITDVAGQPISTSRQATQFSRVSREAAALSGVKWWPGVQTYPVRFIQSCGIDRLTGLQGRPQLVQPALTLGSLLFEILKAPRQVGTGQRPRLLSTLPAPFVGKPLWNQEDVQRAFEACL